MHKSYYNVKPCQNRLLQMKWDQKNYNAHLKKVSVILKVFFTDLTIIDILREKID